jgi:uncharacterized protein (DUF4213/DUF364 family)
MRLKAEFREMIAGIAERYAALHPSDFAGKDPRGFALEFGDDDRIKEMISLAAINAICQHIMRETHFGMEPAPDSLGLLSLSAADRIGMVGLFFGLTQTIKKAGAFVSIIGPTAGYFPDPLFARGVDVVAGRLVKNGALFLKLLEQRRRWGDATRMTCFQKETYTSIL